MLRELFRAYDIDPNTRSTTDRQAVADRLSDATGLQGNARWGWRYLHNVMQGHVKPGRKFTATIQQLGAQLDGSPALFTQARPMNLLVVGEVRPGSIILGSSRRCARPGCPVTFVPDHPFRKYCTPACRDQHRQEKKAAEKNNR